MNGEHSWDDFLEKFREYMGEGGRKAGLKRPPFPPGLANPCQNVNAKELCEEFVRWGTEASDFMWLVYEDLYGDPGTVDPPPRPPFKGG
jgi:hypothetical protein